ncbi:MAG: CRISPR-associated endonuclease Cas1 [Methanosarcina sp.]|nr:CRISPR-associated endonuclease Cas1 [Methanosarcina sp.]
MDRLVVDGWGKSIGTDHDQIIVKEHNEKKTSVVHRCIPDNLRQVVISGRGSISTDAIELLAGSGVDVILLDWKGEVRAHISPPVMRTVNTRREQYLAFDTPKGAFLAVQFINSKISNMTSTLGTFAKSRKESSPEVAEVLKKARDGVRSWNKRLEGMDLEGKKVDDIRETVMGFEGNASAVYWQAVAVIIPPEFEFKGRSGRYAEDPFNAMLNYGYGILEGECRRAVHFAGLDPYAGFLHVDRPGRASVVYDLMEEFRQQVVDKSVIKLFSLKRVSCEDFSLENGVCKINDKARKLLLSEVLNKLESQVKYEGKSVKWTDLILKQAYSVAKFLRGESEEYRAFRLRW